MNKTTITAIMFAVAVLATGCKKADNDPSTGPAQETGKAIDQSAAAAAQNTREGAAAVGHAADRAGQNIENAADRAGQNMREAGAEVRQESHEAARDVKEGAKDATNTVGKGIERVGEKMQTGTK